MNELTIDFCGASLAALPSGALWWPAQQMLCVSDLHLGKSERIARRGGTMLPPYETRETLARLMDDIVRTGASHVLCLGDSFDDLTAARDLETGGLDSLRTAMAGRRWTWIEGNHDPGPVSIGGTHLFELRLGPLVFRHIAQADGTAEVSGHYHPKARLRARGRNLARRCFLVDDRRLILPAYGTYTGGLFSDDASLSGLMAPNAQAILLPGSGKPPLQMPMPRQSRNPSARSRSR